MTKEAVVLAGGLGTRLSSVVKDVPKPMAEVNGHPFLDYILFFLAKNGIRKIVLAVGHKHHIIQEYLKQNEKFSDLQISYSVETELLGTGGAIFQAMDQVEGDSAFIVNGDTSFDISLSELEAFGQSNSAEIAIALKELPYSDRYGQISCSESGRILSFSSDGIGKADTILINGGIYYLQKKVLQKFSLPKKFSIEQDFFQPYIEELKAYGKVFDSTFIDIGIPDDYELAQRLLKDVFPK